MNSNFSKTTFQTGLGIRFHLTDGSVQSFVQSDEAAARKIWEAIDPARLFVRPRIIIGSEHSKSVFATAEIARVDFIQDAFQCWDFPPGYADIVELSEGEFHNHVRLGQPIT